MTETQSCSQTLSIQSCFSVTLEIQNIVFFKIPLIKNFALMSFIVISVVTNVTYYGKNFRHFFTRAAERMGISTLTEKRFKNVKDTLKRHF